MKPTIMIEDDVYKKIMHWVNKSQYEVSGLGTVKVEEGGILRVVSAMLLPQKNGSAHTDIEAEDVNKALFQLRESEGELRWWWHSHVQMNVFWSGTDHDTIKKIGEGGWMAATVFNQKKEVKSCYYSRDGMQTPWGFAPLMIDDLETKLSGVDDPRVAVWDEEYEKNVTIGRVTSIYGNTEWGKRNGAALVTYDAKEAPPLERPKGMPKKVFKEWNSEHVKYVAGIRAVRTEIDQAMDTDGVQGIDEYGFTIDERALLAREGWTLDDVDRLLQADLSPSEMLRIAALGVAPSEIQYMMQTQNYVATDIIELLMQSESFGDNLFDQPQIWEVANEH